MEHEIKVLTYLQLRPAYTEQTSVRDIEIKTAVCKNCLITVKHTGIMELVEETDRSSNDPKTYRPLVKIDWNQTRQSKIFGSLQKVLLRIFLRDKSTTRKFVLQKLAYNYDNMQDYSPVMYDKENNKKSVYIPKEHEWNDKLKQL